MKWKIIYLLGWLPIGLVLTQREASAQSWAEEIDKPEPASTEEPSRDETIADHRGESSRVEGDSGPRPRAGFRLETHYSTGLLVAGMAFAGTFYGLSVAAAVGSEIDGHGYLAVPVLGPWLTLGSQKSSSCHQVDSSGHCCTDAGCHGGDLLGTAAFIIDGVAQAVGVLIVAGAVASPEKRWVTQFHAPVAITPLIWNNFAGALMTGDF